MSRTCSIFKAAERGDISWLRQILKKEEDIVDVRDDDGATPLMHAAANGRAGAVEVLLTHGADPKARDLAGDTVLIHTLFGEGEGVCMETVTLLRQKGVCINDTNGEGLTPLHMAVAYDDVTVGSFLIETGADMNKQDDSGQSPLIQAVTERKERMLVLLLRAKADVDQPDNQGRTALMLACGQNAPEFVRHLIAAGADVWKTDRFEKMPIDHLPNDHEVQSILCKKLRKDLVYR